MRSDGVLLWLGQDYSGEPNLRERIEANLVAKIWASVLNWQQLVGR